MFVLPPLTRENWLTGDLALNSPQLPREQFAFTQLRKRPAVGFLFGCAMNEQLLVTVLKVLGQLLDDLALARRLKLQARKPRSDLLLPVGHGDPSSRSGFNSELSAVSLDRPWLTGECR